MSEFGQETIDKIWNKGTIIDGWNSNEYRLDAAGAMMVKSHRGKDDIYDWEIDHVYPKDKLREKGIPECMWNEEVNLRPFNAKNNNRKSNDYPRYTRALVFDEEHNRNIESERGMVVNETIQKHINEYYGLDFEIIYGNRHID